jgi:predicted RNA methylase
MAAATVEHERAPWGLVRRKAHGAVWRVKHNVGWERPNRRALGSVVDAHGYVVAAGPFAGMRYIDDLPLDQALVPRLLGAYEAELSYPVQQLLANGYDTVIDVGSSEGYYAVGFALRSPASRVHAFDNDEAMRERCARMAALNGVADRVEIHDWCSPDDIEALARGRTLVISDCEGGELDLLQPDLAPVLQRCDILVELHDLFVTGVSSVIRSRFEQTHDVFVIESMHVDDRRYRALEAMRPPLRRVVLDDRRPEPMQWFMLWSRGR